MRMAGTILLLLLCGCSAGNETFLDCYSERQFKKHSLPSFSSYIMNVKSGENSRIDIYTQLPLKSLRFEKKNDRFVSSYSLTYIVRNEKKEIVYTNEIDRTVSVGTFDETVSNRFDIQFQAITLVPGDYTAEVISKDNVSRLSFRNVSTVRVDPFASDSLTASSMLFLDTIITDEKGKSIRPILPPALGLLHDSVGIFQELYHAEAGESISVSMNYFHYRTQHERDESSRYFDPPYRVGREECNDKLDTLFFSHDTVVVPEKSGTLQIFQFYPLPPVGANRIVRTIRTDRNGRPSEMQFTQRVFIRDHRALYSPTMEEIVSGVRHIMTKKEYDSLTSESAAGQSLMLNRFWQSHGGREKKKEFEQRIQDANDLFTTCMSGSQTPMGIAYLVCGPPDYIDCRGTFNETWVYSFGNRAFSIQFRRESEDYPYFVMVPFSVNEALWQYFIDKWRKDT